MSSLLEVLEKSSSLLKREQIYVKPLERVLFESSSLLNKVVEEESTKGASDRFRSDGADDDDPLFRRIGGDMEDEGMDENLRRRKERRKDDLEDEEEEDEDEGRNRYFLGESLLVEQGFRINEYLRSLGGLSLTNLRELRTPIGDLPLSQFLFNEKSFLLLSSIEETKSRNLQIFKNRVKEKLKRHWQSFQTNYMNDGYHINKEDEKMLQQQQVTFKKEKKEEYFSSILLQNIQNKNEKVEFSSYLKTIENFSKIEIYKYLENLNPGPPDEKKDKDYLVSFLEQNFLDFLLSRVAHFFPTESTETNVTGQNVIGILIKFLQIKYNVPNFDISENKWELLFLQFRIAIFDMTFVNKYFKRTSFVHTFFFKQGESHPKNAEIGREEHDEKERNYKSFLRTQIMLRTPTGTTTKTKPTTTNRDGSSGKIIKKIEDYLWFQLKFNNKSIQDLKKSILSGNKDENYYLNNYFLYFKLNLLLQNYKKAINYYFEKFPGDRTNFFHFYLLLHHHKKLVDPSKQHSEMKEKLKFGKTLDSYLDHLKMKDRLIYCKFLKNQGKMVRYLTNQTNEKKFENSYQNDLLFYVKKLFGGDETLFLEFLTQVEELCVQRGDICFSLVLNFFNLSQLQGEHDDEANERIKNEQTLKIVKKLNFLILNKQNNNDDEEKHIITEYSERIIQSTFQYTNETLDHSHPTIRREFKTLIFLTKIRRFLDSDQTKVNFNLLNQFNVVPTEDRFLKKMINKFNKKDRLIKIFVQKSILENTHISNLFKVNKKERLFAEFKKNIMF